MSALGRIGDPTFCNKCGKTYIIKESTLRIDKGGGKETITCRYRCPEGHEEIIQFYFKRVCPAYHISGEACLLCGQTAYDD